jgi:ketosteroid isomerase-like protein
VFTPLVIRGLQGRADLDDDGYVTGTELGSYVLNEVISLGHGQKPQFGRASDPGFDLGDIVFEVPAEYLTRKAAAAAGARSRPVPTSAPPRPTASGENRQPAGQVTDDLNAIRAVVMQYRTAYERRDPQALLSVWPAGPDLTDILPTMRSYRLELTDLDIQIAGDSATVTGRRHASFQAAVGSPQDVSGPFLILLSRQEAGWTITTVK